MKKLLLIPILLITNNIQAQSNDAISYNYLELGYGHLDLAKNISADGFYLEGSFEVSDHFYIGAHLDNRNDRNIDFDRYDVNLGFHTNGSKNTDFYTELRVGNLEFGSIEGNTLGLFGGTRTAFNDKFELVSQLGFTNIDGINRPEGNNLIIYEANVKGIFKFTKNQSITTTVESYDGDLGAKIGYRYSF